VALQNLARKGWDGQVRPQCTLPTWQREPFRPLERARSCAMSAFPSCAMSAFPSCAWKGTRPYAVSPSRCYANLGWRLSPCLLRR